MANSTNLDAISDVAGTITLFGAEHTIFDLDGQAYREIKQAESEPGMPRYTDVAYRTVARIVPTLTPEQVDKLSGKKVGMIIAIADGRVLEVESQFPNGPGPASDTPTPPA